MGPVTPLGAVRGVGVMVAGPLVLAAASLASGAATFRALMHGRRPRPAAAAGVAATVIYGVAARRWMAGWGTTSAERQTSACQTHAVTIDAPADAVWPWLAQIGQDRGGFYSYEWLENLAGCRMRNASRVHPEWQQRALGDKVPLHPEFGLPVARFDPGRALTLDGWGEFALEPLDGGRTRLIARGRVPTGRLVAAYGALLELPHFIMERRMLLGIKERAEAGEVSLVRP
jgi:hypothetical protein